MKTTLYMLKQQSTIQMMSYVIQTGEGKLIVIDGGMPVDGDHLVDTLVRLGGPNPVVELWLLTHPHTDHIGALLDIFSKPNPLVVKKIYRHFWSYDFYMDEPPYIGQDQESRTLKRYGELEAAHPELFADFEKGQHFTVDDVEISVLHVPQEPIPENRFNNSSVVFRVDAHGQRILFTGDLGVEAGELVLATVPHEELKCDFVQMAHHGQNGVKKSFYETAAPKACLWNTPPWLWDNDPGTGFNTGPFKTIEVREWMKELGIRHHFIEKDGEQVIELPCPLD